MPTQKIIWSTQFFSKIIGAKVLLHYRSAILIIY